MDRQESLIKEKKIVSNLEKCYIKPLISDSKPKHGLSYNFLNFAQDKTIYTKKKPIEKVVLKSNKLDNKEIQKLSHQIEFLNTRGFSLVQDVIKQENSSLYLILKALLDNHEMHDLLDPFLPNRLPDTSKQLLEYICIRIRDSLNGESAANQLLNLLTEGNASLKQIQTFKYAINSKEIVCDHVLISVLSELLGICIVVHFFDGGVDDLKSVLYGSTDKYVHLLCYEENFYCLY